MTHEYPALAAEYLSLRASHWDAIRNRAARVILGSSVIRVFRSGTKGPLLNCLGRIPVDEMAGCTGQTGFKDWFEGQLDVVACCVRKHNTDNARIEPGGKWGHSTKVLCLYLRDLVLQSRYFNDRQSDRISKWLYAPIDGVVMRHMKSLGVRLPFSTIREIDSKRKFYMVQDILSEAARGSGVPRVWFDDIWGTRESP